MNVISFFVLFHLVSPTAVRLFCPIILPTRGSLESHLIHTIPQEYVPDVYFRDEEHVHSVVHLDVEGETAYSLLNEKSNKTRCYTVLPRWLHGASLSTNVTLWINGYVQYNQLTKNHLDSVSQSCGNNFKYILAAIIVSMLVLFAVVACCSMFIANFQI